MRLFRGLHTIPDSFEGCVATIGNFDGLHLGHQSILSVLNEVAEDKQQPSLVILFEPQPKEFFAPEDAPARLSNFRDKFLNLSRHGIDYLLCISFNEAFRSMTADAFIQQVLVKKLNITHLIVGDDFRFGCDRKGDYNALVEAGKLNDFSVEDSLTFEIDNDRVSSTRIRQALEASQITDVNTMLARPYRMSGRVIYGRQLGRTINTPTANIHIKRKKLPMTGVFVVQVIHEETGQGYLGVANLGLKPSIDGEQAPSLEVHLFGFEGDLYYQHLSVNFLHKLRDEKAFTDIASLQVAIEHDKQSAKQYFAKSAEAFRV